MYDNCEESVNYNVLYCHACLSSNSLCAVGDYLDIYVKICDNSRMNLTSQVNLCCDCMDVLKQVAAFKKKVENAQRFLDFCVIKEVPLEENLSDLPSIETTTLDNYHILEHENADEYMQDELMIRIEDVRGRCDITDVRPTLDLSTSSCDETVPTQPGSPEDEQRRYRQWKRTALLVYDRICSHQYAHHFLKPVSDELAPLYSRIVRRPTDLSTIKRRIKAGIIRTTAELTRALLLMFSNALMYNSSCHKIYQMALEFREETIRELSLLQEVQSQTQCPAEHRRSARECPARAPPAPDTHAAPARAPRPRRASVWDAAPRSAPETLLKSSAPLTRRRKSMWDASQEAREFATPVSPATPPPRRLAPATLLKPSAPLTRRRQSMWDASQEARECATPVSPATPPPRRLAPATLLKPPAPLTRRRQSMWDASQEDLSKTAVSLRPRRKSVYQPRAAEPPARRRAKWDWPYLDSEYLVASCFKKYKSTVLL